MATGAQKKRQELKEKRLKAEQAAKGADRRKNLGKIIGISAFLAVVAVVIVVLAVSGGSDEPSKADKGNNGQDIIKGIDQKGNLLGDANAKVTLVEFGDLQCPVCKQYADQVLPDVIAGPVKDGTANFEFQNWAILGPDSILAAKATLAAGEQDRMWNYLEAFYANQGLENAGYVDDNFLTDIAEKAGIEDIDAWNEARESTEIEDQLAAIDDEASDAGFSGTPSFAFREADGSLTPLSDSQSAEAIIEAINEAAGKNKGKKSGNNQ